MRTRDESPQRRQEPRVCRRIGVGRAPGRLVAGARHRLGGCIASASRCLVAQNSCVSNNFRIGAPLFRAFHDANAFLACKAFFDQAVARGDVRVSSSSDDDMHAIPRDEQVAAALRQVAARLIRDVDAMSGKAWAGHRLERGASSQFSAKALQSTVATLGAQVGTVSRRRPLIEHTGIAPLASHGGEANGR